MGEGQASDLPGAPGPSFSLPPSPQLRGLYTGVCVHVCMRIYVQYMCA